MKMLSIALSLCLATTALAAPTDAKAEKEIRAALARWTEAANRGDWNRALQVWAPDLVGWYPGVPDDTFQKEAGYAAKGGAPTTKYQLTINEVIVSGPLAVVRDTWKMTAAGKTLTVRSFEVWERQADQSWKIIRWISAPQP